MQEDLFVGTAGTSVWFGRDRGETWTRPYSESGLYIEARVWALSVHPDMPGVVFAGTDHGVFRSDPQRQKWQHLPSALDTLSTWSLVQAPDNPQVMLVGTQPAGIWRSEDAGKTWTQVPARFAAECIYVHRPRVTVITYDPRDPSHVYAGVEIDGVWRSADGGRSFTKAPSQGLISEDIHGLAVVYGPHGRGLFATTNKGLCISTDDGESWTTQVLDSPWQYTRTIIARGRGEGRIFLTNGDGPPGSTGRLLLSDDHGVTWRDANLPGTLNSTPWCLAMNPADPSLIFCCSNLGQIFRSEDGGDHWVKLKREFGEVRCAVWQPRANA
jgi:photosystem II stability/assembly factor-like uncharacterized protein